MKISLLITTFNRGNLLRNSLNRLLRLTLPDDILIVDDGSQDQTNQIVEEYKTKLPIRYLYNNNPKWSICSFARNIGLKNIDSDIVITSEPEVLWVTDVIPQMLNDLKEHPTCVISAGSVLHAQPATGFHPGLINDPITALKDMTVEVHEPQPRSYSPKGYVKTIGWVAPFCALYKKEWLMNIGGWDEEMPGVWGFDDHDLLTRLRINGNNQIIDNDITVIHQWHNKLPVDVQNKDGGANDIYFTNKKLDECKPGDEKLIANKGKEWGILR